jgi:branched-chain amino acid transport system permease protein
MIIVLAVVRLRGIYAAVLTLAFAEVVRLLVIADRSGLTGGRLGLSEPDGRRTTAASRRRAR